MSRTPKGARLGDEQLVDWLRLIRSENIGPRTFRQLINRFGGASAALAALPELAARVTRGRNIRIASRDDILQEIDEARLRGVRFATAGDPDYPPMLAEIADAPPVIALRGDSSVCARDAIGIVGSRNASAVGLAFAERLAHGLAAADFVVVSGLARGIDAIAHRATLATGAIAVLAGGHARPYPAEHERLADEIAAHGLVISEMPLNWEPRGRDFPRRNRIISGVSRAVVVVEGARRSGSLITARFAVEQGREVFAVPGSPLDPRAEGTNDLIRQGATLCSRAEDVIEELRGKGTHAGRTDLFDRPEPEEALDPLFDELDFFAAPPSPRFAFENQSGRSVESPVAAPAPVAASDPRGLILELLGPAPVSVNDLARASGLPAHIVQRVLVELDVAGKLTRHDSETVSIVCGPIT